MKSYLLVLKLMLRSAFRLERGKGKKSKAILIAYIFLAVFYAVIASAFIAPFSFFLGRGFGEIGQMPVLMTIILITSCAPVLVMGLIAIVSSLYFARDVEFWSYMPVKAKTVFAAKMTLVYFGELLISAAVALPALIAAGIGGGMGPLYYIIMVIGVLAAPLLVLIISAMLALPAMFIVTFFKARGAMTSVAIVLVFAVIMGLYSLIIGMISAGGGDENGYLLDFNQMSASMAAAMTGSFRWTRYALLPLYALSNIAAGQAMFGLSGAAGGLVNLALFIAPTALIVFAALSLSGAIYQRGASSQLEGKGRALKIKSADKSSSVRGALMKREWREMLRTPSFAFQCLAGAVMTPVMSFGLLLLMRNSLSVEEAYTATAMELLVARVVPVITVFFIVMFLGVNLNTGASTIISREGKKYYYAKLIPVDYQTQYSAKIKVYLLLSAAGCMLTMLISVILAPDAWYHFLLMSGFLLIYIYAQVHFSSNFDLRSPKLDWTNPTAAVKNSKNVLIPYFTGMAISVGFIILFTVPFFLLALALPAWGAALVSWGILYAAAGCLAATFKGRAYKKLDEYYERM